MAQFFRLFGLLLGSCTAFAFGQTGSNDRYYALLGANVNYHVYHDEALSPLRYAGFSYGATAGYSSIVADRRFFLTLSFCPSGTFTATTLDKSSSVLNLALLMNGSIGYGWRISSGEDPSLRVFVGPALHFTGNLKTHSQYSNNAMSFDVYASLAALGRVEKDIAVGDSPLTLSSQVTMPLLGWMARPYYSTVTTDLRNQGDISLVGLDNRIMWFGTFPMMTIRTDVHCPLSSGSALGIGYEWEFYSTGYRNLVQAARHGAYVFLQTKL